MKRLKEIMKKKKGFTLIELIVTIAVLGILVLLASPRFFGHTQNAELTKGFANAKAIEEASELYYMDHEDWPRLTEEPYTSEEIESYSERIFDRTGQEVNLDPEGNYYDIDYDKLSDYVKVSDDKRNYILQNPVGKVFYMDNLNETGIARVDYSKEEDNNPIPINEPINFAYTGQPQNIELGKGTYKLEVWGAQGGGTLGGKGGYSKSELHLTKGEVVNVYVGGQGDYHNKNVSHRVAGGWNGGGTGGDSDAGAGGGGGASDIRIGGTSLSDRVIVAAGGGGSSGNKSAGGYGGGLIGESKSGIGGTQTAGGAKGDGTSTIASNNIHSAGKLGVGGLGNGNDGGGGGGGYYGGGGASFNNGGGGGSSYIGGVQNGQTIPGNKSMPNPNGGTMVGNSGHGFARITRVY